MRTSVIVLAFVALVGCSPQAEQAAVEPLVQPVKLYAVNDSAGERMRTFPAVVEAAQVAQLAFRVGGEIQAFPAKAGHEVAQGDLIAQLDPTDYQLVLDQAQARLELAQRSEERRV